jgi:hypothetical protein
MRADDGDRLVGAEGVRGRGAGPQAEQQDRQQQKPAPADHGVDPAGREGGEAEDDDHGQGYVGHDRDPGGGIHGSSIELRHF